MANEVVRACRHRSTGEKRPKIHASLEYCNRIYFYRRKLYFRAHYLSCFRAKIKNMRILHPFILLLCLSSCTTAFVAENFCPQTDYPLFS